MDDGGLPGSAVHPLAFCFTLVAKNGGRVSYRLSACICRYVRIQGLVQCYGGRGSTELRYLYPLMSIEPVLWCPVVFSLVWVLMKVLIYAENGIDCYLPLCVSTIC